MKTEPTYKTETDPDFVPNGFEVSRTHTPVDDTGQADTVERCDTADCPCQHLWSVYKRTPDGSGGAVAEWISDHSTAGHAYTAARAYAYGAVSTHLLENIAAVVCVIAHEVGKGKPEYECARENSSAGEGWPGFLEAMITAGLALTDMEATAGYGVDFEWYDTVDAVAEAFTEHHGDSLQQWHGRITEIFERLRAKENERIEKAKRNN